MIAGLRALGLRAANRLRPSWLWRRLDRLGRARLDALYLVLSFDCDTPEDAEVVDELDARLRTMDAAPAYAVPGALLERFRTAYDAVRRRGAPFLNHGHQQHTFWNPEHGRHESCYFYDRLSRDEVARDVERGHETLGRFLGSPPAGFRTPHFGTFQRPEELRFLHGVLARLGYRYSSSTVPAAAFARGPVIDDEGVLEFPVTGIFGAPLAIHDSWGFFAAPDRSRGPGDYVAEARALSAWARARGFVGILNLYADPSHVWDQPAFFEALAVWLDVARPVSFEELCERLR